LLYLLSANKKIYKEYKMVSIAIRKIMYNSLKLIVFSSVILISDAWMCPAASLNLSWDANTEDDLAGYKVYYGNSSGNYGEPIDIGNVTEYELQGLNEGVIYYIALTAYDTSNNESEKSDEVSGAPPDTQNPTITITSPTSSQTHSTSNSTITIGGTASDNVGVTSVTWSNNRGGSGSASGTTSWSVSNINLSYGDNVFTIIASDAAGNSGSDTITINYTLTPGGYTEEFGDAESSDHYGTVEDTYINLNHDKNYNYTQLNTYTLPTNSIANAIIMKWNLSSIPDDAYIQSATLSLYLIESGGDDGYTLSTHKIINHDPIIIECDGYTYDGINSWTDSDHNPPLAQADIQPAVDSQDIDNSTGYKSWNVTQIVRDWMNNPETNYGILINSDHIATADSHRYFASTENENSSRRPKLIVTFFVGDDTIDPTITITDPVSTSTYETAENTIDLGGTASDNVEVTEVTWSNDRSGSGSAFGTTNWSVSNITLQEGYNIITVTAHDPAGNTATDTFTVTYTPPDTQNPTINITSPTSSSTYSTSNSTITISGTASDNRGVTSITWSNNRGSSGSASGTTSWTISNIPLLCGKDNIITVTAEDAAGNSGTDNLTLNVRPCKPVGLFLQ